MLRARAGRAQPENVNNVVRLGKAVFSRDILGPLFDGIRLDFDGCSAVTANQMVMMRVGSAGPK